MSDRSHHRNLPVPFLSQREVKYNWEQMANVGTNITGGIHNDNRYISRDTYVVDGQGIASWR